MPTTRRLFTRLIAQPIALMTISLASLSLAATLTGCAAGQSGPRPAPAQRAMRPVKMPEVPEFIPTPIDDTLQQRARTTLAAAFDSSNPVVRAQTLEASVRTNDPQLLARASAALKDKNSFIRFAGAMAVGDAKIRSLYREVFALRNDNDPNVQVAVRYAMHRLGDKRLSSELSSFTKHPSKGVRANTAMVLGRIGEPTAVRILRPMLNDPEPAVFLTAAESLWRLGNEQGLEMLVSGTVSKYPDDQMLCVIALAQPKDSRVKENLIGKLVLDQDGDGYLEVQLAAARALGMIGSDAGFGIARGAAMRPDPRHRTLAALALGEIGRPDCQATLAYLMNAPEEEVKVAAATGVLELGAASVARSGAASGSAARVD